jgi:hypothetical protein
VALKASKKIRYWGGVRVLEEDVNARFRSTWDLWGMYDPRTRTIHIDKNRSDAMKHITFLHEAMHWVDHVLVQKGLRRRDTSHAWITLAAPLLVGLLADVGLWQGVTPRQVKAWLKKHWSGAKRTARHYSRARKSKIT